MYKCLSRLKELIGICEQDLVESTDRHKFISDEIVVKIIYVLLILWQRLYLLVILHLVNELGEILWIKLVFQQKTHCKFKVMKIMILAIIKEN